LYDGRAITKEIEKAFESMFEDGELNRIYTYFSAETWKLRIGVDPKL
jgi:hypothetical protein